MCMYISITYFVCALLMITWVVFATKNAALTLLLYT